MKRPGFASIAALALSVGVPRPADAVPYFARKYGVACSECHVTPPKTNANGEAFAARGYRLTGRSPQPTIPFAVWASSRADGLRPAGGGSFSKFYVNRVEIISGASVLPWLSYFIEWRPVSFEAQPDRTLRDRSGRFEDLFVTARAGQWELQVGQFRQTAQVDVSRRVGVTEPLVFAGSVPGDAGGTARQVALRAFSPSGRSPALRAGWGRAQAGWRLAVSAGIPFPGEWSIPLTDDARVAASNEHEWKAKGLVLEAYARRGLNSFGGHAFLDNDRFVANAVVTGTKRDVYWTLAAGAARAGGQTRGQWSAEWEFHPHRLFGVGGRGENRVADGLGVAIIPYVNVHFPGTRYTVRLTIERRYQQNRGATFVELATIF